MLVFKAMLDGRPDDGRPDPFARRLEAYLRATLHIDIELEHWDGAGGLPIYLARRYRFYHGFIADHPCLFMAAAGAIEQTPKEIEHDVQQLRKAFEGIVVFAAPAINSTLRARLIAHRVAFAIPGNQLYIPYLALDLRDHFRAKDRERGNSFSPAAQMVFFHHMLRRGTEEATPSALAEQLGYTPMSIGRAFDELAQHNLAIVEREGREKTLRFKADRRTLWEGCRTLLRSPVRGVHAVRFNAQRPAMPLAGESALARLTMLAPPRLDTYAIVATEWQAYFKRHAIGDFHYEYEGEAKIETWRYDPRCLGAKDIVDPLSLFARYWDDADERLAQAAAELMDRFEW